MTTCTCTCTHHPVNHLHQFSDSQSHLQLKLKPSFSWRWSTELCPSEIWRFWFVFNQVSFYSHCDVKGHALCSVLYLAPPSHALSPPVKAPAEQILFFFFLFFWTQWSEPLLFDKMMKGVSNFFFFFFVSDLSGMLELFALAQCGIWAAAPCAPAARCQLNSQMAFVVLLVTRSEDSMTNMNF